MKPLLLCVCMEPGRLLRLSMIAGALGITVKEIKEDQVGQRLEALCGLKPLGPGGKKARIGTVNIYTAHKNAAARTTRMITIRST